MLLISRHVVDTQASNSICHEKMLQLNGSNSLTFLGHFCGVESLNGWCIFQVEVYNPVSGLWTSITPMLSKRCRLGVAALHGRIYVAGGYDGNVFLRSVECYDPNTDRWSRVSPMNIKRSRVALAACCGRLYAIGGYDGTTNLSTVECYNPELDQWSFVASMCAHEGGVGVGVVAVDSLPVL